WIGPYCPGLVQDGLTVFCCRARFRVGARPAIERVRRSRAAGSDRGARVVAAAMLPELQPQRAAVMRVLLDDAVSVAGNPDVVLVVDVESMDTLRHPARRRMARRASVAADRVEGGGPPRRGGARHVGRPGVYHVPRAIEFDDRGRRM